MDPKAELRQFLRTKCGNLKAAFTDLDLTETGQLKREDFEAGLQRLGFPQDCAELWKQLDRQKQGVVNQRSFVSGLEDSYPGRAFHPGMNTPRKFECLAPTLLQRLTPNASNASVAGAIAGSEKGSGKSSSSSPRKAPLEERVRRLEEQLAHEQEKRRALEADLPHRFREILREELQELRQQVAADAATASSASVSVSPKRPTFAFSANIGTRRSFPGSDEREELQHCRLLSSVSDKHLDLRAASASVETPSIQEEERGKQVAPSTALRQENLQLREQLLALREQAVEAKEREKAKRQSHSPPNLQRSERRESRGAPIATPLPCTASVLRPGPAGTRLVPRGYVVKPYRSNQSCAQRRTDVATIFLGICHAQQVSVLESLAAALEVAPAKVILWPASGAVSSSSATSTTARRLAEESVATCSFNLVIDDASARVLDLTTGTEPYRVFLARLSEALAVAQLPMPSCFRDPKMGVENVKVEDNFELAESVWVAKSDWSECPAKCGKAWQSRSVACSTSNEFACNASGAKLATEQSCEKYVDCKWEWTCPFSRSASVTCGVQLLLTGVAGFAALLLLWCCLHMLRQCCKWAPKMGEMALMTKSGEQMKVNFYIVGAPSRQGQGTEVDKEATMLDSVWGPEKTGEKCHVVWDVDPEQAAQLEFTKATMQRLGGPVNEQQQQVLERLPEVLGKPAQAVYNTRSMLREQRQEANQQMELQRMASMAHQAMSTNRSGAIPPVQEDIGPELAFHTGDRVEYFSTSHCRWTGALVDDATNSSFIIQLTPHYQPNDKNQKRLDVQIEHLRRPLWEGELVSVYVASLKTWERGVIYGKQHASVTVVGYKVQILGARARILNSVPAHFVWRRFETDMAVEVYDLDLGWRSGKVLWDAEMNELAQDWR
ncbi:unnamed protein product [Effrenium voratum]|nr:unnamed protein product [Effrenium voratum]